MMSESTLSAREVAGLLRVSTRHLRGLVRDGRVPQPVRFGACLRWPALAFHRWVDEGCPDCGPVKDRKAAKSPRP